MTEITKEQFIDLMCLADHVRQLEEMDLGFGVFRVSTNNKGKATYDSEIDVISFQDETQLSLDHYSCSDMKFFQDEDQNNVIMSWRSSLLRGRPRVSLTFNLG